MKATAAFSLLAGAATAVAQNVQSKPFKLVLESDDKETNGQYVAACHSGAAIESLCIGGSGVTMHLNTTEGSTPTDGFSSPSGILTWTLPANIPVSESMILSTNPASNVAQAMFFPGYDSQYVAFDDKERMTILSNVDDTKNPIEAGESKPLYRWYSCEQYYTAYRYTTLSWVYGVAEPQNPSCVKVDVKREFE